MIRKKLYNLHNPISRRKFLTLGGTAGLSLAVLSLPISCDAVQFSDRLSKVSMSKVGMGTFINVTTLHPSQDSAEKAISLAYEEIERLSSLLSRHDPSSSVSILNTKGILTELPPELFHVLKASKHYNHISQGAFDITVLPVLDLYEESFKSTNNPPSSSELENVLSRVSSDHIDLNANAVSFAKPDMKITLDSIAKGYIIDRAMDVLKQHGIKHALINAGGDIAVHGGTQRGAPWKIAIQDPKHKNRRIEVVEVTDGAIATSGNYEVYFDEEKVYHHLISPLSLEPIKNINSTTVRARTVMEADALATTIFVLGKEQGIKLINDTRWVEGFIVDTFGKKFTSESWYKA